MSKRTIIFQEHRKITIKEIDESFYFTILYYDKWSSHNIIKQSEYIVVAACRGLMKICLEEVNGKDYLSQLYTLLYQRFCIIRVLHCLITK